VPQKAAQIESHRCVWALQIKNWNSGSAFEIHRSGEISSARQAPSGLEF